MTKRPVLIDAKLSEKAASRAVERRGQRRRSPRRQARPSGNFKTDAAKALNLIKSAVGEIIFGLGMSRPVDLQRLLRLDATLGWQLFKIATEANVLTSAASMPSRASLEKFSAAAVANGAPAERAAALSRAYELFEAVVERHASDRITFISLATSAAGITDEWFATDLQHRRNTFRAFSHAMGVQAQTRVVCQILGDERSESNEGYRFAFLSGYVNVRTLRQLDRVRVYGSMIITKDHDRNLPLVRRWPLGKTNDGVLLSEFSSKPLPELIVKSGVRERYQWTDTAMISPQVGNLGSKTVMFGEEFLSPTSPDRCQQRTSIPCELLLIDVLAPVGRIRNTPKVDLFLGDQAPLMHSPDSISMPLPDNPTVIKLGQGPELLDTPAMPGYSKMVRSAATKCGFAIDHYETWRLQIEFPYYQSTAALLWTNNFSS